MHLHGKALAKYIFPGGTSNSKKAAPAQPQSYGKYTSYQRLIG
jgi:hypothetical protein